MLRLVSAELFKVRTTRAYGIIIATAVVLAVAQAIFMVYLGLDPSNLDRLAPKALADAVESNAAFTAGLALLVGLMVSTGEFRHRTIITTFLGRPDPTAILGTKLIAAPIAATVMAVIAILASTATMAVGLARNHIPIDPGAAGLPQLFVATATLTAVAAAVGVAVGAVLRNAAAAVAAVLLWMLVIEGMVLPSILGPSHIYRWLPVELAKGLLTAGTATPPDLLNPYAAAMVLAGYAIAFSGISLILDRTREI